MLATPASIAAPHFHPHLIGVPFTQTHDFSGLNVCCPDEGMACLACKRDCLGDTAMGEAYELLCAAGDDEAFLCDWARL